MILSKQHKYNERIKSINMIHFQLPRHSSNLYKNIDYCEDTESISKPKISNSLSHYIYEIKERIQLYDQEWDIFKRYTNPYEYIHTNVPNKKKSVSFIIILFCNF